jgi:hypothetical protein
MKRTRHLENNNKMKLRGRNRATKIKCWKNNYQKDGTEVIMQQSPTTPNHEPVNLYYPTRSYAMANGLACYILISVCLLRSNLTVHAKPEKLRQTQQLDTTGI